ncbi:MAG: hypothetical protein ACI4QA_05120 [Candidatus Spyradosoma sp.]
MDTFIITGANAEPAQSIARRLCEMGARVYGIAGTFPEAADFAFNEFIPVACDVTDVKAVAAETEKIVEREHGVAGVIFCTQYLACDAFEAMATEEIALGVNALVATPLVIARLALPSLVASRGSVIVVSPNTVTPHGHVLNNVVDAAMKVFAGTLFGELRDTGVRTCHIFLQNNTGTPDPAAQFSRAPQSRVQPDIVAETVETVLRLRENNALTQIVLRPQATRETPHIPVSAEPRIRTLQVVRLPESKNYPPAEEPILTPKYRRPEYAPPRGQKALDAAEEAVLDAEEFSDDYVDPELRYLVKEKGNRERRSRADERAAAAPNPPREDASAADANGQGEAPQQFDENGNPIRRKRRRRRKKKNRNGAMMIQPPQLAEGGNAAPRSEDASAAPERTEESRARAPEEAPQEAAPAEAPARENAPAEPPQTVPAQEPREPVSEEKPEPRAEAVSDAPSPESAPAQETAGSEGAPESVAPARRKSASPRARKPRKSAAAASEGASAEKPKRPRRKKTAEPAPEADSAE